MGVPRRRIPGAHGPSPRGWRGAVPGSGGTGTPRGQAIAVVPLGTHLPEGTRCRPSPLGKGRAAEGARSHPLLVSPVPQPCLPRVAPLPPRMAPAPGGAPRRRQDPPPGLPLLLRPGRASLQAGGMLPVDVGRDSCSALRGRVPPAWLPEQVPLLTCFYCSSVVSGPNWAECAIWPCWPRSLTPLPTRLLTPPLGSGSGSVQCSSWGPRGEPPARGACPRPPYPGGWAPCFVLGSPKGSRGWNSFLWLELLCWLLEHLAMSSVRARCGGEGGVQRGARGMGLGRGLGVGLGLGEPCGVHRWLVGA